MSEDESSKIYIGGPANPQQHAHLHEGEISPLAGRYAKMQTHWNKMSNFSPGKDQDEADEN